MDSVKENYKNVFSTKFSIKCYTEEQEENWDSFVKQKTKIHLRIGELPTICYTLSILLRRSKTEIRQPIL